MIRRSIMRAITSSPASCTSSSPSSSTASSTTSSIAISRILSSPCRFLFAIHLVMLLLPVQSSSAEISAQCIDCICAATAGCSTSPDVISKCKPTGGRSGGVPDKCGPYQLSYNYWSQGGRKGPDFGSCVTFKYCAENTIRSYMRKHGSDCNRDGVIDCTDYALIHVLGPNCRDSRSLTASKYWSAFKQTKCFTKSPRPFRRAAPAAPAKPLPPVVPTADMLVNETRRELSRLSPARKWTTYRDEKPVMFKGFGWKDLPLEFVDLKEEEPVSGSPSSTTHQTERATAATPSLVRETTSRSSVDSIPRILRPDPIQAVRDVSPRLKPKPPTAPSRRFDRPDVRLHVSSLDDPFADDDNEDQETRVHEERELQHSGSRDSSGSSNSDASSPASSSTLSPSASPSSPDRESVSLPSPSQPAYSGSPELPLSRQCLKCICNANSNCDENIKCVLNEFCGPYLISQRYWTDAGRPGTDYKSCAFNKTCAEQTVQAYMSKYYIDCNGDKYIDCDDFVAIHQLGPKQCQSSSSSMTNFYSSNYWNYYQYCYHLSPSARREEPAERDEENVATRRLSTDRRKTDRVPRFTVRPTTPKTTTSTTPPPPLNEVIDISNYCMNCLCEANGCNKTIPCDEKSPSNRAACGPFLLDYNYWLDAAPPVHRDSAAAFVKCANDRSCAESVVRRYLSKWANDCNADGFIDCLDYAVLHRLGPKYCNSESIYDSLYFQKFQNCFGFETDRPQI